MRPGQPMQHGNVAYGVSLAHAVCTSGDIADTLQMGGNWLCVLIGCALSRKRAGRAGRDRSHTLSYNWMVGLIRILWNAGSRIKKGTASFIWWTLNCRCVIEEQASPCSGTLLSIQLAFQPCQCYRDAA